MHPRGDCYSLIHISHGDMLQNVMPILLAAEASHSFHLSCLTSLYMSQQYTQLVCFITCSVGIRTSIRKQLCLCSLDLSVQRLDISYYTGVLGARASADLRLPTLTGLARGLKCSFSCCCCCRSCKHCAVSALACSCS